MIESEKEQITYRRKRIWKLILRLYARKIYCDIYNSCLERIFHEKNKSELEGISNMVSASMWHRVCMIRVSWDYEFNSHIGCSCSVWIPLVESPVTLDVFGIDGLCSNKDLIDEGLVFSFSPNLFKYKSCQLCLFKFFLSISSSLLHSHCLRSDPHRFFPGLQPISF